MNKARGSHTAGPARRGFTLVELLIVVAIIGLLSTLAFVVLSRSIRDARSAVERQALVSVRNAVESFKQDFNFLPPLVFDDAPGGPVDPTTKNPRVRDDNFLRSGGAVDAPRWSSYSITLYLFGTGEQDVDGVAGPGYTEPQRDGTFTRRGRDFAPRLDISRDPGRLKINPADPNQALYLDRWGKAAAPASGWPIGPNRIRYYRWLPAFDANGQVQQYLVPRAVGDPNVNTSLRDATYAIVSVGPDGRTDERRPLPTAGVVDGRVYAPPIEVRWTADDLVEVGR